MGVGWLNTKGGFENKILYNKVSEAAAGLDTGKVIQVLKNLEEKQDVNDPTAWVSSALRKEGGGKVRSLATRLRKDVARLVRTNIGLTKRLGQRAKAKAGVKSG